MLLDVFDQAILILPHLEEIVVLAELFHRAFAVGAEAIGDIFLRPKSFVKCAVPSRVVSLVNQLVVNKVVEDIVEPQICVVDRSF